MKNMQIWPYYVLEGIVWFSDSSAGGIYTYNCKTEEVNCIIRPDVLFRYDIFEVVALACWKNFAFIFSEKLNGSHIVYNCLNGKIRKFDGVEDEYKSVVHQAIVIDDILYLIPLEIREDIYILNLLFWHEKDDSIKLVSKSIGKGIGIKTWLPKCYGRSLYIPEYEGKRIFCVTDDKVELINVDIPFALFTIGVFEDELWAVPLYGKYVFCLTTEGKIKEKVEISYDHANDGKIDIWEVVPKTEYVFFLYWKKPEINIYNRKIKKIVKINGKDFELPCKGSPGDRQYYLPYVMDTNIIRFLPSRCDMLEIELSNFVYRQRKFGFPLEISDKEWDEWCKMVRNYRYNNEKILYEENGEKLEFFTEYMLSDHFLHQNTCKKNDYNGKKIYQYICDENLYNKNIYVF